MRKIFIITEKGKPISVYSEDPNLEMFILNTDEPQSEKTHALLSEIQEHDYYHKLIPES